MGIIFADYHSIMLCNVHSHTQVYVNMTIAIYRQNKQNIMLEPLCAAFMNQATKLFP